MLKTIITKLSKSIVTFSLRKVDEKYIMDSLQIMHHEITREDISILNKSDKKTYKDIIDDLYESIYEEQSWYYAVNKIDLCLSYKLVTLSLEARQRLDMIKLYYRYLDLESDEQNTPTTTLS